MSHSICLNADLGELSGEGGRALDRAMLDIVSRCSIACGGHAGDAASMQATLRAAKARHVTVGVHPSYPDKENFGRISVSMDRDSLLSSLRSQVRSFLAIARENGVPTEHLKPHGALYNDAASSPDLARLIVQVAVETNLPAIIGPPESELETAARNARLGYIPEGFADRRYTDTGRLVARSEPDAVITLISEQAEQVLLLVTQKKVETADGTLVPMHVRTICLHGDTPGAIESALALREVLKAEGLTIAAASAS